ncbi:MAG: methyltransferase domain-containing protein [Deltaproteobacteria bacterium]|nr:methyltransferase domain-containing protein [Deltaproteobacteria bacterium]MBW2359833.1 methyltransferase domain-containing protein [Deltaproteobacteria bacterium]
METREAIQQQFGAAAARYATSSYHQISPDLDAMLAAALCDGRERVLDVGTGTGHTALAFAPFVAEVVGVDFTPAMLQEARRLAAERGVANVRFDEGDAMALPYAADSFDLVTCRVCAHHFADPAKAVLEVARVLRPGGRFLLVDSVAPEDPAQDTFFNTIELLRDRCHVRNHRISEWCSMLLAAGFVAEHLDTYAVPLDFEDWVERIGTPEVERAALRALFRGATRAVTEYFALRTGPEWGFDVSIGLLRARLPAAD